MFSVLYDYLVANVVSVALAPLGLDARRPLERAPEGLLGLGDETVDRVESCLSLHLFLFCSKISIKIEFGICNKYFCTENILLWQEVVPWPCANVRSAARACAGRGRRTKSSCGSGYLVTRKICDNKNFLTDFCVLFVDFGCDFWKNYG